MQKKLLLVFIVVNCAMIHANELPEAPSGDGQNKFSEVAERTPGLARALAEQEEILRKAELVESELNDYQAQQYLLYRDALVKDLFGESKAIDELFVNSKKDYNKEEEDSKKLQDDSSVGFTGSYATSKTRNGIILQYFLKRKESKEKINKELKQVFNDHGDTFNRDVMKVLEDKIVHKNYEMEKTFSDGLDRCGGDVQCLRAENVHLPAIMQEGFFDDFSFATFKPVIDEARKKKIPLTEEEIIMISKKKVFSRGDRKLSMGSLDDSKKKVLAKLADIFNSKQDQDGAGDDRQD